MHAIFACDASITSPFWFNSCTEIISVFEWDDKAKEPRKSGKNKIPNRMLLIFIVCDALHRYDDTLEEMHSINNTMAYACRSHLLCK